MHFHQSVGFHTLQKWTDGCRSITAPNPLYKQSHKENQSGLDAMKLTIVLRMRKIQYTNPKRVLPVNESQTPQERGHNATVFFCYRGLQVQIMEEYQGLVSQPLDSEDCGHTDVCCLSSGIPDTASQVPVYFGPSAASASFEVRPDETWRQHQNVISRPGYQTSIPPSCLATTKANVGGGLEVGGREREREHNSARGLGSKPLFWLPSTLLKCP